jgi:3'-phosphoadenosine 5'-phosphosulfate sulfotransferase (PAPS reductase)/FAD synthetase
MQPDRSAACASPRLVFDALQMLDEAISEHGPSHVFAMFSGGHDSLTSTAIAAGHPSFTAVVHINTGVGIAETREFVRETCGRQGWPLIELHPDGKSYRDLVIEKGMPGGPKAHNTQFYWLKQRAIRRLVREHKQHRHGRIALVTGIRASESERRMAAALAVPVRRNGAQLWLNPILDWTATDCSRFMGAQGLQRNPVVDLLHRSGECLCGALAKASEISEIEAWFPAAAAELHEYERLAREAGHNDDVWAGRARRVPKAQPKLPLCWSCEASV